MTVRKENTVDNMMKIYVITILVSVFIILSFVPAHAVTYLPFPIMLKHDPTICAIEPTDPQYPTIGKKLLDETEYSVIDWKTKLNERLGKHSTWNINLIKIPLGKQKGYDYSNCDVSIYFKREPNNDLKFIAAGRTIPNDQNDKSTVEIYYLGVQLDAEQTNWREGNYIYTKTTWTPQYTGYLASDPQIAMTIRHELGHAFGLGHYIIDDKTRNKILYGEMVMPSIMVDTVMVIGVTHFDITPIDIEQLKMKYGNDGFNDSQLVDIKTTKKSDTDSKYVNPQSNTDSKKCKGKSLCIVGILNKVIDGDTLIVKNQKIRLSLTNAPEKDSINFKKTVDFIKQICPVGSSVIVDQDDKQPVDRNKTIVGKVICSGKIINAELLYNDHANILKQSCAKSEFVSESWVKKYGC